MPTGFSENVIRVGVATDMRARASGCVGVSPRTLYSGSPTTFDVLPDSASSAALAGIAMGFVVHQVGGSWFAGGFDFGGAHAFFRVLGGFFWALVGYGAHALKGRDLIESEQDIHERNT